MLNDIFTVVFAIEMFLKAVSAGKYLYVNTKNILVLCGAAAYDVERCGETTSFPVRFSFDTLGTSTLSYMYRKDYN